LRLSSLFLISLSIFAAGTITAAPTAETEKVRNEKVAAYEVAVQPGATVTVEGKVPTLLVYSTEGTVEVAVEGEKLAKAAVRTGDVVFRPAKRQVLKNAGSSEVRFVRVDFLGAGEPGAAAWGPAGLSSSYKVILENQYARVYTIGIPAGTNEPQHTHHDRIVICFQGAQLMHLMPDGRKEPSTLKTGDIVWRNGGTHIGQNLGKTDLRALAVEPK